MSKKKQLKRLIEELGNAISSAKFASANDVRVKYNTLYDYMYEKKYNCVLCEKKLDDDDVFLNKKIGGQICLTCRGNMHRSRGGVLFLVG